MSLILIVDDDARTRELFASLLTPFGHQVLEANDGKEGLEQARLRNPDLIISDILMPTMNGYEFVTALRILNGMEHTPVIFHSASFLDHEAQSLGASCGVSLFLPKPCEPEAALALIHRALGTQIGTPSPPASVAVRENAIPVLIDAFFEKGKKLDALSLRLAALLDVGLELARPCEGPALLRIAGHAAREMVCANYAAIGILQEGAADLQSLTLFGMDRETVEKIGTPAFRGGIFRSIIASRKPQRAFSPHGEPINLDLPAFHPSVHSFMGVPLQVGERLYGWIYVAQKLSSLEFTDDDERALQAIAAQTGVAYENALGLRAIRQHAATLETEVAQRKWAEDRFQVLVETSPTSIVIADQVGRIVEVNAQVLRVFGYQRPELIGRTIEMLLPERLRHAHPAHRLGYMKEPHSRPLGVGMDLFACRKDGTEFPVEISLGPLVTKHEVLVVSTIVDITERKKMEQHLRLSQRMEAIGKLAGGVAHDFNNLLAVILGCSDVLVDMLPAGDPSLKKIEMIRQAGASAADLTRQLLAFSRQQMLQPRVLDLKDIVDRTQALLRRLIGENIELKISMEPSLGRVMSDPGQIEQVLLNLAVNARDAMPKGGRLTIEAHNVELDGSYHQEHRQVVPGRYVMIAVVDTGCGMDRATQSRIFDPFFTTKELGQGTGLGLATVYGIVKQSGGFIWVYSEVDKGTVFKVYLPRTEQAVDVTEQKVADEVLPHGCETILLAEDSDSLREMTHEYLKSLGYTILEAASGKDALQRASEFAGCIHLLLTDVVMPEMSGPELACNLATLRPGIKVIFTSGYTDDAIARQGVLDPGVAFIQKPYRPKALARKIREVLYDAAGTAGRGAPR